MKVAIKITLLLLVVGYLIFAIVEFSQRTEERVCEAVDIEITDSLEGGFVTADYIHGILTKNKVFAEGKKLSGIDIQGLEEKLQKLKKLKKTILFLIIIIIFLVLKVKKLNVCFVIKNQ